ncbi:hypothetical protein LTR66_017460 [Elasticomyces elasticus]|nr:hypothetical protein LTR66_017460 [Elasticomyces elasticus]
MPIQLEADYSGLFDILYGVEPPNNTRGPAREPDSEVLTDDIALRVHLLRKWDESLAQAPRLSTAGYEIQRALGDETADYQTVWESKAGGVTYLQEPSSEKDFAAKMNFAANLYNSGFLLRTPDDGGKLISLLGASVMTRTNGKRHFEAYLINSVPRSIDPLPFPLQIPHEWESTDLLLVIFPLTILRIHVDQTLAALSGLILQVEAVERDVRDSSADTDFDYLIRLLHFCDADLIKLEMRWNFEKKLVKEIIQVLDKYRQASSNYQDVKFINCDIGTGEKASVHFSFENAPQASDKTGLNSTKPFMKLCSFVNLQEQRCRAPEYDFSVLPRRITNQFTAVSMITSTRAVLSNSLNLGSQQRQVYNLVAQRDAKATRELALGSTKIAEATLRDSSSMKTIAAMTLIFLPATFACVSTGLA